MSQFYTVEIDVELSDPASRLADGGMPDEALWAVYKAIRDWAKTPPELRPSIRIRPKVSSPPPRGVTHDPT